MKSLLTSKPRLALLSLVATVVLVSPLAVFAQTQKRAMTFEDVMSLRVVSDPRISPDGKRVAFVVTQADMKTNFRNSDVWLVSADGGDSRQLTRSPKRDDQPRWSADSRSLAFISDRDGKAQVYVLSIDGGEARKVTDVQTAVQSFEWAPDGKRIAYIATDPVSESREKEKKEGFDQIIADSDYQYAHINIIDVADGAASLAKAMKLTDGDLHVTEIAWSHDGGAIAFTARSTPKLADSGTTEIYMIDADGKQNTRPTRITNNDRSESNIAWSPAGNTLSYLSNSDKYPSIGPSRIHLLEVIRATTRGGQSPSLTGFLTTSQPKVLLPQFNDYITRYEWSSDGRVIYFAADRGTSRHLWRVSSNGNQSNLMTIGTVLNGPFSLSKPGSSKAGAQGADRIAALREEPWHPAEVFLEPLPESGDVITQAQQLTHMNPQLQGLAFGRVETVKWKSSKDGREIEGILVYPIDYEPGKRYPLITSIHGGPEGAYQLSFMASYGEFPHIYAGRGYASFFPNFRGSSNYGYEFASANVGDLGGGDYQDIMSGVDYLIQRGIADPARLAIKGYSYGGYMSGWIIGHTDRFKAAVFGAGLSNAISYYSQADIQFGRETLHQGTPWRNNQNMIERSPVFYLQNAKTPSLIYQGEKDERVPLPQSLETYMGLKKAGVTTQLIIYPREGHGLREPAHQLDKMRREMEWVERYVRASDKFAER
jgi:dipeptidyl aminopeptidase/acylaminoacyl peptidase